MRRNKIVHLSLFLLAFAGIVACSNDDNPMDPVAMATCNDGIMNGDETGVDCGGSCSACDGDGMTGEPDFSGMYTQVDHMGRPGINTVLGFDMDGQPSVKDAQNVSIPSEMAAAFQAGYEARLEQYHDVYAGLLGFQPEDVDYENNILGLDATVLTTYLAADVLEVAPDGPTTYFNPGTDNDGDGRILVPDGDEVGLTGRTLQDDVIDISLILLFGGYEGDRFSGQDTNDDGVQDLPRLTSDGVGITATIGAEFPFVGNPQ